ncbi:MAG: 2-dehydropantoate 2-reductase [Proteobacteria bacterium]|nr:2-dehydropantoate 2-reductase [Pseudomonadota bacterium]MDA1357436.1 2-dehydropantoate 2-reductase [Pseudomonadota bacterium]
MKIGIVGTGAMGSVYAALLGDAGNEVWAVDSWAEHVAAMAQDGLTLKGASGTRTVHLNATTDASTVGLCDLIIIATKAMDVAAAAEAARAMLGPDTTVLTIQNGLGSAAKVASALGTERVVLGVVGGFGASITAPGKAHHNGMELVRLGEMNRPVSDRVESLAELWRGAGFTVKCFDDIDQLVWEKLICNCAFSASSALTGWTVGEILASSDAWSVASNCALEAYFVARASNIRLDIDDPISYVRDFGAKIPHARPSMLLDHMAGRRSEIDAINGAIPAAAARVGVKAPVNETVSALVRAKEEKFMSAAGRE